MPQILVQQDWYPRAERDEIVANQWRGNDGRTAVVIHIAQGGYKSSVEHMRNHGTSAHFIVSLAGQVCQMVSVNNSSWANGATWTGTHWVCPHDHIVVPRWGLIDKRFNPNSQTISIEHEGMSGAPAPAAQLAATVELLRWLGRLFPTLLPFRVGSTLIRHADIDPVDKAFCCGDGIDLLMLARRANEGVDVPGVTVEPWVRAWGLRGVALPPEQKTWAIPQLYSKNWANLGACLALEQYPVDGLSIAIFERGFIYYLKATNRAYLVTGFAAAL